MRTFLGRRESQIFAAFDLPPQGCERGVVICPPLFIEMLANSRREVELARAASAEGIAVVRFHYLGTGHSDDSAEISLASLVADATLAATELVRRTGVSHLAFVGTRVGATVAALMAGGHGAAILAWEPVLIGADYFREGLRARLIRELALGGQKRSTARELLGRLAHGEAVDILGYEVGTELHRQLSQRNFVECLAGWHGAIHLMGFSSSPERAATLDSTGAALTRLGHSVTVTHTSQRANWWLLDSAAPVDESMLARSVGWLRDPR